MKKVNWLAILVTLVLSVGCIGAACAEIIPALGPGQQIGYPAVVLCEKLTLREKPDTSSKAVKVLEYGALPIVICADMPEGATVENGFIYCTLGDSETSPIGWLNADFIVINPAWYVTEKETPVYAWNDTAALKVALLEKGVQLPILQEYDEWYLVSLRGAVGYIHK